MITEQFFWGMALGIAIGAVAVIVWLIVFGKGGDDD